MRDTSLAEPIEKKGYTIPVLAIMVGLSRGTMYRRQKESGFPQPVNIKCKPRLYDANEVDTFIKQFNK